MSADPKIQRIAVEPLYQGYFRLDRWRLRYRRFDGGWSEEVERELFERGHAAALLLYDPAADTVLLIEQFRVGAYAAGRPAWLLEVVAGIIEPGESAEQVARREALEEAGIAVQGTLEPVAEILVSPGASTETIAIFAARFDSATAKPGLYGLAEEAEDIRVHIMPLDEALDRCDRGDVANATTLVALYWLARHRDALKSRWSHHAD